MQGIDVCVRGRGAVAQAMALALCSQGLRVALAAGAPPTANAENDVRAFALNAASRELLVRLKVWDALAEDAVCPVLDMQVAGDAPGARLNFSAWSQGVQALAWIVDAQALEQALGTATRFAQHLLRVDAPVPAPLQVLAEGRDSASRAEFGAGYTQQTYGQSALAARLDGHEAPQGPARQWVCGASVLALLPFDRPRPDHGLALVWSLPQAQARHLRDVPAAQFEAALAQASGSPSGAFKLLSPRSTWPLAMAQAQPLCGPGWVLVGDAAHVIHPLAGQGLNLGLGDVQSLATVLAEREPWRSLGDERLLRRHARQRSAPVLAMTLASDGLMQLFSHPAPWVGHWRNRGMNLLDHVAPLKRALIRRAMG